eukprot:gnl/Chilomastix_caulleri/1646.p2 GENE.gnl/Chilomastix_caulleri/1646~~gnl/Chilomastix_caulleri/1646.p2  ORF type:complete len:135 (+),score=54.82 gnl/Chilomastix_caulleri/1646:405-809(+)
MEEEYEVDETDEGVQERSGREEEETVNDNNNDNDDDNNNGDGDGGNDKMEEETEQANGVAGQSTGHHHPVTNTHTTIHYNPIHNQLRRVSVELGAMEDTRTQCRQCHTRRSTNNEDSQEYNTSLSCEWSTSASY